MNRSARPAAFAIVALCAAYFGIRLWRLADSCLWFDEIFSIQAATEPWSSVFGFIARDLIHPPLSYVLLKFWLLVGGDGLYWVRLFPVMFSAAAVVPLLYLARDLKLRSSQTIIALVLLAANGSLIKYAQEVRMYAVVLLLATLSVWLFVRFFYLGKNIWLLTMVNALLVLTHYFGWMLIVSEIVAIILLQRIKIRQTMVSAGICALVFAPWLAAVGVSAGTTDLGQNIGWINAPGIAGAANLTFDLVDPFYYQASSVDPASMYVFSVPILLILFATGIVFVADRRSRKPAESERIRLLAVIFAVPVAGAFIASWALPYSIWGTRHLMIVFVPFAIVASIVVTDVRPRALRVSAVSILGAAISFAAVAHFTTPSRPYIWCAWENFALALPEGRPLRIYAFEDLVAYDLWFALRKRGDVEIVKVNGVEGLVEDRAYFIPRGFSGIAFTDGTGISGDRFFVAFRDSMWNEKHPPLRNLVESGYRLGEPKVFEAQGVKAFLVEVTRK